MFIFQCTLKKYIDISHGDIAQLARAPALQAGGQGFDSLYLHHANIKRSYNMKMFERKHIEKYIEEKIGKLDIQIVVKN